MTKLVSIDAYLPHAPDLAKAALPLGMLLAWCANLRLLSEAFEVEYAAPLLRLRMQEIVGSELLVACGGDLRREMFNEAGLAFVERYLDQLDADLKDAFGKDPMDVDDNWANYGKFAKIVTRKFMGPGSKRGVSLGSRIKSWWQRKK